MSPKDNKKEGKTGFQEAMDILFLMSPSERTVLLSNIKEKDPEMFLKISESLIHFSDLKKLSLTMFIELLRHIDIDDLGLALRMAEKDVVQYVLSHLSSKLKKDVENILNGPPVMANKAEDAVKRIEKILKNLYDNKKITFE